MLSYQITQFRICVPLTDQQWDKLESLDGVWLEKGVEFMVELEKAGASEVDWSGHFGRNIFFTADADFDACEFGRTHVEAVVKKIEELLGEHPGHRPEN